jgi:hypothetical protein
MDIHKISLEGRLPHTDPLSFVSVEVPVSAQCWVPFALVRYSRSGKPQKGALRLDLDKRMFADHLEGQSEVLDSVGGKIADIVAIDLRRFALESLSKSILNEE